MVNQARELRLEVDRAKRRARESQRRAQADQAWLQRVEREWLIAIGALKNTGRHHAA